MEKKFEPEFPGQHQDEKIELVFRQHPIVLRKELIIGLLIILAGTGPLLLFPLSDLAMKILIASPIITLAYWFYHWIGWHYSINILTDSRLISIKQRGFFNRKVSEVGLDRVQSINYHIKGLQAALFKFGDITVQTFSGEWLMKSISHPVETHTKMIEVARKVSKEFVPTSTVPDK
ncbi:MAG TPA: PH domain-containing protein [Candidatus Dormibacteraeota bacterium]|nr:PH domain-containing protein [Candidatus Dormibacteraeota bacterium]